MTETKDGRLATTHVTEGPCGGAGNPAMEGARRARGATRHSPRLWHPETARCHLPLNCMIPRSVAALFAAAAVLLIPKFSKKSMFSTSPSLFEQFQGSSEPGVVNGRRSHASHDQRVPSASNSRAARQQPLSRPRQRLSAVQHWSVRTGTQQWTSSCVRPASGSRGPFSCRRHPVNLVSVLFARFSAFLLRTNP